MRFDLFKGQGFLRLCVRHDKEVERSTDGDYCDQTHWGNLSDLRGLKLSGLQLNMENALKRFLIFSVAFYSLL